MDIIKSNLSYHISINTTPIRHFSCVYLHVQRGGVIFQEMLHIMAIDAIIVHDMKINEYSVHFSVYFQRVTPSEKVEIVSTLYFNTAFGKYTVLPASGRVSEFLRESERPIIKLPE